MVSVASSSPFPNGHIPEKDTVRRQVKGKRGLGMGIHPPEHGPNSPGLGPTVHPPPRRAGVQAAGKPPAPPLCSTGHRLPHRYPPCPSSAWYPSLAARRMSGIYQKKSIFTQQVMHIIVQVFIKKVGRRLPGILLVIPPPTVESTPKNLPHRMGFQGHVQGKKKILKNIRLGQ